MHIPALRFTPHALALVLALGSTTSALAQASYAYSVSLTVTAPKGSAAETAAKNKKLPLGIRFSPCDATALDQFAFTIKYDAGKPATASAPSSLQNVYLVVHKDGSYFPLIRRPLLGTAPYFASYSNPTGISSNDTYTAAADNLGGVQTEVILGGNLTVQGLPSGIWNITAIIAEPPVNFDAPATWSAWDTVPFMLRKPWTGTADATCN